MGISIPVLMYHQVSDNPHPYYQDYTVTTKTFAFQMKILKHFGFMPITLSELVMFSHNNLRLPHKPIIITFDDGMKDAIDNAVPILQEYGFTAIFYIPTNFVGIESEWMIPEVNVQFQIIDWPTIRSLDSLGFEIGSHTMNHPWMNRISTNDCYKELQGSRKALEDFLGHEIKHLAYPFGAYNDGVISLAKETGYHTACTTEEGIAQGGTDLLQIPRLNMGLRDSFIDFIFKIHFAKTPMRDLDKLLTRIKGKIPSSIKNIIKKHITNRNI